ncbi:hypothetical protein ACC685_38635, partial [Rhizobium ruizarguesonis]
FLDREFIEAHTIGLEALKADIANTEWASILKRSGLTLEALDSAVDVYLNSRNVILCYVMGIIRGWLVPGLWTKLKIASA